MNTIHPVRTSSPSSPPSLQPTIGWLLCLMTKRPPPKAKALSLSLFFDAFSFGIPTKGTSRGESKTTTRRLQQTRGEPRHHDLRPWQMLPWRYRAQPLGVGWQRLILFFCVVCCVLCDVCCVLCVCVMVWCFEPVDFLGLSSRIFC
jgi:hypothetical protein